MKTIQIFLFALSFLLFHSCGSGELPLDEKGREDFIAFHQKFYQDSAFQLLRIEFPMLGVNTDDSKERFFWDENNWVIQKTISPDNPDVKMVPFYDMDELMRERIIIQNRFMIENLFSLINNRWYLTSYSGMQLMTDKRKKEKKTEDVIEEEADSTVVVSEH